MNAEEIDNVTDLPKTELEKTDRLEIQLLMERRMKLEAQVQAALLQAQTLRDEHTKVTQEERTLSERIKEEYQIGDEDTVDVQTGKITRKKG